VDLRCVGQNLLGIGTADGPGDVNPVPRPELPHAVADRLDDPGRVGAGSIREDLLPIPPRADVGIYGVNADGVGVDNDLPRPGLRVRNLLKFKNLGTPGLMDPYCLHDPIVTRRGKGVKRAGLCGMRLLA
jgi:hypothetical protein